MEERLKLLADTLGSDRVKLNADISEFLASNTQTVAQGFYIVTNTRELIRVVDLCEELKINFFIIGSGSKTIFPENRFSGLVIKNRSDNLRIFGIKGKISGGGLGIEEAFLEADSGATLVKVAEYADFQGLSGLEELKKLYGTIGGALLVDPVLREKVLQIKIYNGKKLKSDEEIETKTVFDLDRNDIVLSAVFKLKSKKHD